MRTACHIRTLILAIASLLLAACGPVRKHAVDATIEATRTSELRRAESHTELTAYAQRSHELERMLRRERNRVFCTNPANQRHWRCPSRPDKPRRIVEEPMSEHLLERIAVTGSRIKASDIITNNQEAGVDEGDIVKKFGNLLFVLRRGALHSVDIGTDADPTLTHVSRLDAAILEEDEIEEDPLWYDEILVAGNSLILLGFNWEEDRSELLIFNIDTDGTLSRRAHYGIAVDDYFSGSNYGARIEADNLLLSLSSTLHPNRDDWPSWRRLDQTDTVWQPLIEPEDVYLPVSIETWPTLHLIARCPLERLGQGDLDCITTGIIGNEDAEFYASSNAAYLSVAAWDKQALLDPRFEPWMIDYEPSLADLRPLRHTLIYRIAFDAEQNLQMAEAQGITGNQFSFMEYDNSLFLTTETGGNEDRTVNLQRIGVEHFSNAPGTWAEPIAQVPASDAHRVFRFSSDALWIGSSSWSLGESGGGPAPLLRQPLHGGQWESLPITHSTDTLEPLGGHMLALGNSSAGTWHASLITDRPLPRLLDSVRITGHTPADHRSHAVNFTPMAAGDWLIGFPGIPLEAATNSVLDHDEADEQWVDPAADLLVYRLAGERLLPAGTLAMDDPNASACTEHCIDWYGNARIFFIGPRIFALSGGVLAEARMVDGKITETGRITLE